jgi:hypothetical protein
MLVQRETVVVHHGTSTKREAEQDPSRGKTKRRQYLGFHDQFPPDGTTLLLARCLLGHGAGPRSLECVWRGSLTCP